MTNDQFIEELRVEANLLRDRDWKGDQRAAELLEDAAERIDSLADSLQDAQDEAYAAQEELEAIEADDQYAQALWEAIVERRTEDAVVLLRRVFDIDFMDVRTYGNLFPERIK